MQTKDFNYHLPRELIAQEPASDRVQARLMRVCRATGEISHYHAADLPLLLKQGDLMVLNDTRVIPARVFGRKQKTGGKVETLFIAEHANNNCAHKIFDAVAGGGDPGPASTKPATAAPAPVSNLWEAFLHSSGRPKIGDILLLAKGKIRAQVQSTGEYGRVMLEISCKEDFFKILQEEGLPPLPPYIKRPKDEPTTDDGRRRRKHDYERYQTVYARVPGAIAAPTAGLHLSNGLMDALEKAGIQRTAITLHVGPGTFIPVKSERVEDHKMEAERFIIAVPAARVINTAMVAKRRVVAVGTTVVRALESMVNGEGKVSAGQGSTNIFIYPPYRFKAVNALLTNFHLPCSTLLMLVSAFAGRELIRHAYETAVKEEYRFYSYGDCMLIA